jgi:hypothetical protein
MNRHCNRFSALLCATITTNLWVGSPANAAEGNQSSSQSPISQSQSANWLEATIALLELIHDLLEGDSAKLNSEPTLSGKLSIVGGHYAAYGIPSNLSGVEREELINAIFELYGLLDAPPSGSPIARPTAFLGVLTLMWVDLGLLPVDLGVAAVD